MENSEYSGTISITIESDEISIFPNPTAGMVEIRSKDILEGTMRLTTRLAGLSKRCNCTIISKLTLVICRMVYTL